MKRYESRVPGFFLVLQLFYLIPALVVGGAEAKNQIILEVIANEHNEGQHFFQLTKTDDLLVKPEFLDGLRLRKECWKSHQRSDKLISLRSIAPELRFTIDHDNGILELFIDPNCFSTRTISNPNTNRTVAPRNTVSPRAFSAFFNYRLQADYTEDNGFDSYSMPMEVGSNWEKWFASSNFTFKKNDYHSDFNRHMTSLVRDDPSRLRRLTFGDFLAPSSRLLNGGLYGGISWGSRFILNRKFRPYPGLKLDTVIETPTRATLYSNGNLIREWDLLPGPVTFSNMELYAGGNAELVLQDAFGREKRLDPPALLGHQGLLRTGLHEYSYNFGFARKDFGIEDNSYDDPTAIAIHRYGINDKLTAGYVSAITDDLVNIGSTMGFRIGDHLFNIEGMYSHNSDGRSGRGVSLNHTFRWRRLSSYLTYIEKNKNFTTPSNASAPEDDGLRSMLNLSLNHSLQSMGALSAGYNEYREWGEEKKSRITLSYQKNLFRHLSLSLRTRIGLDNSDESEILLRFSYHPSVSSHRKYYNNIAYSFRETEQLEGEHELRVHKSTGIGKGLGYNLAITHNQEDTGVSSRVEYRDERGLFSGYFMQPPGGGSNGYLSAAGGVGFLDGQPYLGRPVLDSFAVVGVEGLDDVPIYHNNQLAGVVDDGDTLLVPSLISYDINQILIRPKDLPINYEFEDKEKYIKVGQRSGSRIQFKGFKYSAIEGTIYLELADGKQQPLTAMPLEVEVDGETRKAFTGEEGYFYLENIPEGEHLIRILREKGDCEADLIIPELNDIIVNIGELHCKPIE